MSYLEHPLRIIMVQLPDAALKSHRVLNDGKPDLYPVVVGLSRPVDEYERKELADFHIERGDTDRMWPLIEDTTLQTFATTSTSTTRCWIQPWRRPGRRGRPLR